LLNLGFAVFVASAEVFLLGFAEHRLGKLPLNRARLRGKVGRRAHDDHRFDARGFCRGHVQQRDAAAAQTDGLYAFDLQVAQQRPDIERTLPMRENEPDEVGLEAP
jgi:hypothetical protein